jgi:hypothetical protein
MGDEVGTDEIIELDSRDTLIYTRDDLLGDGSRIDMVGIEAIAQPRDSGCDFVELNAFLASVCRSISIVSSRALENSIGST